MFSTKLTVTIDHINYGNHLAHDKLITMMHEARLRLFDELGHSEFDFYGVSLIMKSITAHYRKESFRGDELTFTLYFDDIRTSAFSLFCSVCNQHGERVADGHCVLVGFDYQHRRIAKLPDGCREALLANSGETDRNLETPNTNTHE